MGVFLMVLSSISFVLSGYFGKIVVNTTEMTAVVTTFSRLLLGAIITGIYMKARGKSFKASNIKPIFARAVFNSSSIMTQAWALTYTTLTNNNMLYMTYPVFVIVLAPFITKEKSKKTTYLYLVLIMIGTYIVTNPSFSSINIGDLVTLVAAVLGALSVLSLAEAKKEDDVDVIVFYVMLFGTFFNLPFAYKDLLLFDIGGLVPVFLAALTGYFGQVFLTWGYKYLDSGTGSLICSSRIVIAALIGAIFLGEQLNFRIVSGILLITISLIGVSGYFDGRFNKLREKTS